MTWLLVRTAVCAGLVLAPLAARAELMVEPTRPSPDDTVVVTLNGDAPESPEALVVTRFPGSRVETMVEVAPERDGQGVRWTFVASEPGLFRVQSGAESATIMVGYADTPLSGVMILALALISLGGLATWGLLAAAPTGADGDAELDPVD